MKTLLIPLQIDAAGRWATTTDPATIIRQQIIDLLMTNYGERIMLPEHGANLREFIFAPIMPATLSVKADEIRTTLSAKISFGEIVKVTVEPVVGAESTVRVVVLFRVVDSGTTETVVRTFTGLVDQESVL